MNGQRDRRAPVSNPSADRPRGDAWIDQHRRMGVTQRVERAGFSPESGAKTFAEAGHRFVNRTPLSRPPISIERPVTSPFSFRRKVMMRRSAGSCI